MAFKEAGEVLSEGFGLNPKQRQLIIRVLWVLAVSAHMAYVCGIFAFMGIGVAPFARSEDVEGMKRASVVNARIQIIQEMRVQKNAWCKIQDDQTRDSILRYLVRLQGELKEITGEIEPVQPDCSRLVVTPPGSP
jgi:hypothetical protein